MGLVKEFFETRLRARPHGFRRTACGVLVTVGLMSGCASMPPERAGGTLGSEELYEGQPEIVYATEFPVESAAEARQRAQTALSRSDVDRALYFYVQAVELEPSDLESLYMIGAIHERKQNRNLAARAYAKVVELDPGHALALQGLGIAHFEAREFDYAETTLQRAVAANPDLWRAHNVLGILSDTQGEHAAAIDHFDAALAVRPGSPSLLNNRGYSKYLSGNYEGAEADFIAALAADEGYDRARRNLGLVHARRGEYQVAMREMSQVSSKHVAANDVGYVAMLRGDLTMAENLFSEAIRLSPRHYATAEENLAAVRELKSETALLAVEP